MDVLGEEKAAVADMPRMPYVLATIAEVGFCNKIEYMLKIPHVPICFIFEP